ncbi:hypothetical protein Q5P01_002079 [Channa striata]|uniref:Vacuolar fusion protein MON1 homolog n=1 Tax=Channa striata TaxID=64152 RepID=A0AA88T3E6_CHASR|nr:hypothetical protein Q5P01_002079 [Channa striata]
MLVSKKNCGNYRCMFLPSIAVMDGEAQRATASWDNGTLAPLDRLRLDRADSPTPGLVEGTEPGAGQRSAMFVHAQSFEDLAAEAGEEAEREAERAKSEGECAEELKVLVDEKTIEEQCNISSESRCKEEDVSSEAWRSHRKHVFVLSEAGKPIYTRYGTEEALSSTMGVMMALVSFVEADKNIIRSIHADGCKVVFLTKSPLVLVGVSQTCQSDKELLRELHYIYYQIVSLLTLTQLNHIFQHKQNYDLRRLLAGSEYLTDNLLHRLDRDPGLLLSAVTCLPLASSARDVVSASLQAAKAKNLVFSILAGRGTPR